MRCWCAETIEEAVARNHQRYLAVEHHELHGVVGIE